MAVFDNQLFLGREGAAQVEVYDTTTWSLKCLLSIADLGKYVDGLAACDFNNCLYVSDFIKNCVHKVDLSTYQAVMKWEVASSPWGLSINTAHNVLVACNAAKKIQEYSSVGSLIREICIKITYPYRGIQMTKGQLAVSHRGALHRVCIFEADGQIVKSYGNKEGSGPGQLNDPRCIAVDERGCILVADYKNNRIVALNPSLTDARVLPLSLDWSLQRPMSLYLDESRGRLYIGENDGERRVLVFENVSGISAMFRN